MDKKVTIATHDGMFHPDDVFSVATIMLVLDDKPVICNVIRTRDESVYSKADFVVDVGSVHDESTNRFDHHQKEGAGVREINGVKYASFGLVWKKFGSTLSGDKSAADLVECSLVSPIDAGDNGQEIFSKKITNVTPYLIDDFIHSLRPTWTEGMEDVDKNFMEAVGFAKRLIVREIEHAKANLKAQKLVEGTYEKSEDKRVIIFDNFYPNEKTLAKYPEPLLTVMPRSDGLWNLKTIRDDNSTFKNRKDLPEAWAGKRDSDLSEITGVSDAVFCHNGRFMAVAKSKEGAIKLAKLALNS